MAGLAMWLGWPTTGNRDLKMDTALFPCGATWLSLSQGQSTVSSQVGYQMLVAAKGYALLAAGDPSWANVSPEVVRSLAQVG